MITESKGTVKVITGNAAAAWGARLSRPDVIAAYPITPQTTIVETLARWVDTGELKAHMIRVESEHSAMAAVMGASAAGARTYTATSSQGLLYMAEMISWAAGARTPIVMSVVDRALGPPWNIWSEHTDALMLRDSGWILFWAANNQEVLDSVIQAYKIAEHKEVILPAMVMHDGFILSHTTMPVEIPKQELVDEFLPPYDPPHYVMNPKVSPPITFGNIALPADYVKFRLSIEKAMKNAKKIIKKVAAEFKEFFGRWHGDLVSYYNTEGVDTIVIALGNVAEQVEATIDSSKELKKRAGVVKVRAFRPFPKEEIADIARKVSNIVVIDRDISFGWGGILAGEVRATLHEFRVDTPVYGKIMGIGGDEILPEHIEKSLNEILR